MEPWMDPELLRTTGGIVTMTIAIVQILKAAIADTPWLNKVPTAAYAVLVSCALTWLARDVLHMLDGELVPLLVQAVMQALMAFGVLTAPTWRKPIGESTLAQDVKRGGT